MMKKKKPKQLKKRNCDQLKKNIYQLITTTTLKMNRINSNSINNKLYHLTRKIYEDVGRFHDKNIYINILKFELERTIDRNGCYFDFEDNKSYPMVYEGKIIGEKIFDIVIKTKIQRPEVKFGLLIFDNSDFKDVPKLQHQKLEKIKNEFEFCKDIDTIFFIHFGEDLFMTKIGKES